MGTFIKILAILAGGALIALSFLLSPTEIQKINQVKPIATTTLVKGQVRIFRNNLLSYENLKNNLECFNLDTIETSEASQAQVKIDGGFVILIEENSKVTIEKAQNSYNVLVKSGEIDVKQSPTANTVFILQEDRKMDSSTYQPATQNYPIVDVVQRAQTQEAFNNQVFQNNNTPKDAPTQTQDNNHKMSQSQKDIFATLNQQKQNFFKCYTAQLQRKKTGIVDSQISLTIESNGKVSKAQVNRTTAGDEQFKKCLVDVAMRVKFRTFTGKNVTTMFPLRFE